MKKFKPYKIILLAFFGFVRPIFGGQKSLTILGKYDRPDTAAINLNFQNHDSQLLNVVHQTSTETIRGFKYFTNTQDFQTINGDTATFAYSVYMATAAGKVGIGTTSPGLLLSIDQNDSNAASGTTAAQLNIKGYAGANKEYAGIRFSMHEHTTGWGSSIQGLDDTGSYGGSLVFKTGSGSATTTPSERLRIDSTGIITYTNQLKTPLTASRAAVIDSAQQLSTSAVTTTELGYVSGVTSPIQTQLTNVGMVFISSASASTSASVSFTGLAGASYSEFIVLIDNVVPSSNTVNLKCQISTGSGFLTSNYRHGTWRWTNSGSGTGGSTSDSSWVISSNSETLGTGANQAASFEVHFHGPNNTTALKRSNWLASGLFASATYVYFVGGGEVDTQSSVIDGIQFSMSSGNISTGKFYLFGIRS